MFLDKVSASTDREARNQLAKYASSDPQLYLGLVLAVLLFVTILVS